jgi:hypothetical protein
MSTMGGVRKAIQARVTKMADCDNDGMDAIGKESIWVCILQQPTFVTVSRMFGFLGVVIAWPVNLPGCPGPLRAPGPINAALPIFGALSP